MENTLTEYMPVIIEGSIALGIWSLGYHLGNRFRLSRIMMRDPKEVNKRIKQLENQINDNQIELVSLTNEEVKDKWKIDRLEAEVKLFTTKLDMLKWIMNKEKI